MVAGFRGASIIVFDILNVNSRRGEFAFTMVNKSLKIRAPSETDLLFISRGRVATP